MRGARLLTLLGGKRGNFVDTFDTLSPAWMPLLDGAAAQVTDGSLQGKTPQPFGANLLSNSELSTDTSSWVPSNGSIDRVDSGTDPGASSGGADDWCAKLTATSDALVTMAQGRSGVVGATYSFGARAYRPSANGGGEVRIQGSGGLNNVVAEVTANNTWQDLRIAAQPLSIAAITLRAQIVGAVEGDIAYFDAFTLTRAVVPMVRLHQSADGTITVPVVIPASGVVPFSLLLRATDIDNLWEVRVTPNTAGNDLQLIERDAGSERTWLEYDIGWTPGGTDEIRVAMLGPCITLLYRKQGEATFTEVGKHTDAQLNLTSRYHGFMAHNVGVDVAEAWQYRTAYMSTAGPSPASHGVTVGTVVEDFEDDAEWTASNGTAVNDEENAYTGAKTLVLTTDGSADNAYAAKTVSLDLSAAAPLSLQVYVPTIDANMGDLSLYLEQATGMAHVTKRLRQGRNHLVMPAYPGMDQVFNGAWAVDSGTFDLANPITGLRVQLGGTVGEVSTVHVDTLRHGDTARAKCILSFDDSRAAQFTEVFPRMKAYGWRGSLYLNPVSGGAGDYLTFAQLDQMYAEGWDCCNHTVTHPDMRTLTVEQARAEIRGCQDWLEGRGYTRWNCHRHFCYPMGYYNADTLTALEAEGVLTARIWLLDLQANDLDSPYLMKAYDLAGRSLAVLLDAIDAAMATGACIHIYGHRGDVEEGDYSVLEALLAYLDANRASIDVVTMAEWYAGL